MQRFSIIKMYYDFYRNDFQEENGLKVMNRMMQAVKHQVCALNVPMVLRLDELRR